MLADSDVYVVAAVAAGGAASAFVDLRSRRVPNALTFGLSAVGLFFAALRVTPLGLGASLAGFAVGLAIMLPGHLVGATGAGDVKLLAAMGTLLGPAGVAAAFLYTALAGGVLALFVAASRGRLGATLERTASLLHTRGATVAEVEHASADNGFAYAPAIAIGALVAALKW